MATVGRKGRSKPPGVESIHRAAVGVPYYWVVDANRRQIDVWTEPKALKREGAIYTTRTTYKPGQAIPVVIDGQFRGEFDVADIFPREAQGTDQ